MDTVLATVSHNLAANVENLTLAGTARNGTGNGLANVLRGNAGDNVLDGGLGADSMLGATGNDVYRIDNPGDRAAEAAGRGTDTVVATVSHALAADVENLRLAGTAALNGTGNALANVLRGNAGANVLNGGAGGDTISTGAGNDVLVGGVGTDLMAGGAGADAFVFRCLDEAGLGAGRDVIRDFETPFDHVDLAAIDADALTAGNQAFVFVGALPFSGTEGELRYAGATVAGDTDGDAAADLQLTIAGALSLTADSFVL